MVKISMSNTAKYHGVEYPPYQTFDIEDSDKAYWVKLGAVIVGEKAKKETAKEVVKEELKVEEPKVAETKFNDNKFADAKKEEKKDYFKGSKK